MIRHLTAAKMLAGVRMDAAAAAAETDLAVSDWLSLHYVHPRGTGPTNHRADFTPYWNHWLEIAGARISGQEIEHDPYAHRTEQMWLVTGNQLGKTLGLLLALWAWMNATYPRACGIVYPQLSAIKKAQRGRAKPILELSPRLSDLVPGTAAERDRRLGAVMWELRSAITYWINGGTSGDTRTQDLPLLFLDEFDLMAHDLDGQGSAIKQLLDRQKTYPHSKLCLGVTTPTWVNGHGWQRLLSGSNERLMIACPSCGAHSALRDDLLRAPDDATPDEIAADDLALHHCPHCDAGHGTTAIRAAVADACALPQWSAAGGWCGGLWTPDDRSLGGGLWVPNAAKDTAAGTILPDPIKTTIRSGHLSSLYSPFLSLGDYAADQRRSEKTSEEERTAHINGWAGLPASQRRDALDERDILEDAMGSGYAFGESPVAPFWLVAFFDQQGNTVERAWFPYVIRAYARNGDSWHVDCGKVNGFAGVEGILAKRYLCGDRPASIKFCGMDAANGNMVRDVRRWCARDPRRRISLALSGTLSPEHPYSWEQINPKNAGKLCGLPVVYTANAHLYRDELLATIRGGDGRPAWHLPDNPPQFYLDSLQSEERVPGKRLIRGRMQQCMVWQPRVIQMPNGHQVERKDNHWWDAEVCLLALVSILGLASHATRTNATAPAATAQKIVAAAAKARRQ